MNTKHNALYADCPYLHYDPRHGRKFFDNNYLTDGFHVLARLVSMTGPAEHEEGKQSQGDEPQAISVTFEVVGADWAIGWLSLPYRDWIKDVKGKPTDSKFSLKNAQLGRFTYQPSSSFWHMGMLNASLGGGLFTPNGALHRWRQGIMPDWFRARVTVNKMAGVPFCCVTYFTSIFDSGFPAKIDAVEALSENLLIKAGRRFMMPAILKQSAKWSGVLLNRHKLQAEHLAVYDVGQGAAQALVRLSQSQATPELYIDMGCGRNHTSDPILQNLKFCTSASPPVILSHADEDHWCGAITMAMAKAGYPANSLAWTAPATAGSAAFMAFARSVWSQGGSVRTLDLTSTPPNTVTAKTQTGTLLIAQGTSKQFNHSGLIVTMVSRDNQHYWLLPGDCDYHFFPSTLKSMAANSCCVALVAFHHGAKPDAKATVPCPVNTDYRRLVYSFGCGNQHDHPTPGAVEAHHDAGWIHDNAWINAPGKTLPCTSSPIRATAWTPSKAPPYWHAGGILIGWSTVPPIPPSVACCTSGCSAAIPTQV